MSSNLEMKPIEYRSECYEAEKGLAELVVASPDPTEAFDAGKVFFDDMTMGIGQFRVMALDAVFDV